MSNQRTISRRDFLRVASMGAAGTALAACAPQGIPAASDAGDDAPAADRTAVRLAHWWGGGAFDGVIDATKANLPEIELQAEETPWTDYHTKLLTEIAGGTGRDVYMIDAYFFPNLFLSGALLTLDDFLASDPNVDLAKYSIDPKLDSGYDGETYGLPMWAMPDRAFLWTNKTMTDEAGIELPMHGTDRYDTWHWSDLLEAAQAVTKRTSDGNWEQIGISYAQLHHYKFAVWRNGGETFDPIEAINETRTRLDEPEAIDAFQELADLTKKHKVALGPGEAEALSEGTYLSGKVAFSYGWGGIASMKKADFDWVLLEIPWNTRRVDKYGGNSWALSSASEVNEAAWDVMSTINTHEEPLTALLEAAWIPSYDPEYYLSITEDEITAQVYRQLLDHQTMVDTVRPWWDGAKAPQQFADIFNVAIDRIMLEDEPVAQALQAAAEEFNDVLANA